MRKSKYCDDFNRRINETVIALSDFSTPKVRRVACFVTDRCNFRCQYCNSNHKGNVMTQETFMRMLDRYGDDAIIHITGGEPSTVGWLYPILRQYGDRYRFHLNTNAFLKPPSESVKRLKISLDSPYANEWDEIVGVDGAWETVVGNIKDACSKTVVSITYTLSKKTFRKAIAFAKFAEREFPGLYAIFFSIYKGTNPDYMLSEDDVDEFYNTIPILMDVLNDESRNLLIETIDEKKRLLEGVRFEQNLNYGTCFISMSERVISPTGAETMCSHLYRDGIMLDSPVKHEKCRYGCNRRLVAFNETVEAELNNCYAIDI